MDTQKFRDLMAKGELGQARELLKEFIEKAITPQEQGSALIALAHIRMEIQNTLDDQYIEMLDVAISELGKLKKQRQTLEDAVKLGQTRKQLE